MWRFSEGRRCLQVDMSSVEMGQRGDKEGVLVDVTPSMHAESIPMSPAVLAIKR